jgi:hypothetical protein
LVGPSLAVLVGAGVVDCPDVPGEAGDADVPGEADAPDAPGEADAPDEADAPGEASAIGAVKHAFVITSPIKVTLPFRASAAPCIVTALAIVMDVRARIVPMKAEPDPRVAELVTCQKTLHELAPLMSFTELPDAVMRSDGAWMIQTEFGSFWPSSVSVPVRSSVKPPAL